MLSSRLWAAREAIMKKTAADTGVRKRLMKSWLLEAEECVRLREVVYSVLPWDLYLKTRLGLGVTLLYISELLQSAKERKRCADAAGVPEKDLWMLHVIGRRMLSRKEVPEVCSGTKELLSCIVSSTYFNTERSGSLVLACLKDMLESADPGTDRHSLSALQDELQGIYCPSEKSCVFGFYSWDIAKYGQALQPLTPLKVAISSGTLTKCSLIERMEMLAERWPACLSAIEGSLFLRFLLCRRAPQSIAPHTYALLDCIEHTWLWMLESKIHVYSTVPDVAYSHLQWKTCRDLPHVWVRWRPDVGKLEVQPKGSKIMDSHCPRFSFRHLTWVEDNTGDDDDRKLGVWKTVELDAKETQMLRRYFEGEVLPRAMEKGLRHKVIVGYLMKEPEPIPVNISALIGEAKSLYVDAGFNPLKFPTNTATAVVRDEQDMDEETKVNCWLWSAGFRSLHLHHELLLEGGVDKDAAEVAYGFTIDEDQSRFRFEHRNHRRCEFLPDLSAWV